MKGLRSRSETGSTIVEVILSGVVLIAMLLAVGVMQAQEMKQRRESMASYEGLVALRTFISKVQSIANQSQDLGSHKGVGSIYALYNGKAVPIEGEANAQIGVTCYADEATVPYELGGPQDLNGDGDANDFLGGVANGSDMRIVPMKFVLSYPLEDGAFTFTAYRLIAKTTD